MKRLALTAELLLLLCAVGVFLSLAAFRVPSAQIRYNGSAQPGAGLYRLLDGDYLVSLREKSLSSGGTYGTLYRLRPRLHEVDFIANEVRVAPGVICLDGYDPPSVLLGPGKAAVPRPTACRVGDLRFVTMLSHAVVRVTW